METLQLTNLTPEPRVGLPVQEISELVRRVAREPEAQREPLASRHFRDAMLVFGARRKHVQAAAPRLDLCANQRVSWVSRRRGSASQVALSESRTDTQSMRRRVDDVQVMMQPWAETAANLICALR